MHSHAMTNLFLHQNPESFDISHAFLPLAVAKLLTVRFFVLPCRVTLANVLSVVV